MIYVVGANLESKSGLATRDLVDINYNKISRNNVKVLLMAGGSSTWKNDYVNSNETSIYELQKSGFVKVDERSRTSMGDKANLSYFLNYAYKNYKSEKYDLIFWNHGGAVDGSEYDELEDDDNLKLNEMREAFKNSPFDSNNKLEVISFRTCLNATIEVANVYKDYAKYLVASEEVTVGSQFDSALKFINDIKGSDNGEIFGKKQIETYKETVKTLCKEAQLKDIGDDFCVNLTYSIIDLSKVDDINENFDLFAKDIDLALNNNYDNISKLRANLSQYAADEETYDMVDMYDFISSMKKYSKNSEKVLKTIKNAVLYSASNNNYSHGLSIYFPYNSSIFLDDYELISISKNYLTFVNDFYNIKNNKKVYSYDTFSSQKGKVANVDKEKADFEVQLTDEQIKNFAKADYLVFVDTKDGYYKLLYFGKETRLDGNKLKATVQGKMLRFSDIEYEDENCWITLLEKEVGENYVDVQMTAILYRSIYKSDVAYITVRIDDKNPNGTIKSIILKNDESDNNKFSVFSNEGVNLKNYVDIMMLNQKYKVLDDSGNFNTNFYNTGNGIYEGLEFPINQFKFIREDFNSEYDYYSVFQITDTVGNKYYSNPVKMK